MEKIERAQFIEMKREMVINVINQKFEEGLYDYIGDANYESIEELDSWLDDRFREYYGAIDQVNKFYDAKLNS